MGSMDGSGGGAGAATRREALGLLAAGFASSLSACGGGGGGDGSGGGGGGGQTGSGTFTAVASMGAPRFEASSALLPSGKVLVAGGFRTNLDTLNSAEVFDPATGQWRAAASMSRTRAGDFLVRLDDGRILALSTGGGEAYTESTDRWVPIAAPPGPLTDPFLKLADGRVFSVSFSLSQTTIYDPATDRWQSFPGFDGRRDLAMSQLPDRRILVSGGRANAGSPRLATTLLFDPDTGLWSNGPNMIAARQNHFSFVLDDGRVVVSHGAVSTASVDGTTEIYSPATNGWSRGGNVNKFDSTTLRASGTRLTDGSFLVAGGQSAGGGTILDQPVQGQLNETNAELFSPATLQWTRARPPGTGLVQPRYAHTATRLLDGRVLLAGGVRTGTTLADAEIYRP